MAKFKITNIDPDTNVVTVDLTIGGNTVTRRMNGVPLDSKKSVEDFFKAYFKAYKAGQNSVKKPAVPAEVTALVNSNQDVVEE